MSPSSSMAFSASRAVVMPVKMIPSGLSRLFAAALSPLTNSLSTRVSSLITRMRLTGFFMRLSPDGSVETTLAAIQDRPKAKADALGVPTFRRRRYGKPGDHHSQEIIILGIAQSEAIFRPADWARAVVRRACAFFGLDQCIRYSPYVRPIVVDGITCLVIDARLRRNFAGCS